jgi:hypothetical protein
MSEQPEQALPHQLANGPVDGPETGPVEDSPDAGTAARRLLDDVRSLEVDPPPPTR